MRGRQQPNQNLSSSGQENNFYNAQESAQYSSFSAQNLHDQAFIIYSDEDILSSSSHSNQSFDSMSPDLSSHSHASQQSQKPEREHFNSNLLDQFANEESSICDVRESQCSESCKELIHTLQPLFRNKSFLRRSPRFATHQQPLQCEAIQIVEKSFKIQKALINIQPQNTEMIEDQKSPLNQNTQILQQKQEQHMLLDNTSCNTSCLIPSLQKLIERESPFPPQIFPSLRQTRSSKKNCFESESTHSNNSRQTGRQSTNEYLSRNTKEFILAVRKEKKIKKGLKKKASNNGSQKARQYNMRHH